MRSVEAVPNRQEVFKQTRYSSIIHGTHCSLVYLGTIQGTNCSLVTNLGTIQGTNSNCSLVHLSITKGTHCLLVYLGTIQGTHCSLFILAVSRALIVHSFIWALSRALVNLAPSLSHI